MLPFLLSLVSAYVLCWPAACLLRRCGVIDRPNARSSHTEPTVRGGGVAIIVTILGGLCVLGAGAENELVGRQAWVLAAGVLLLALVSFIDDLRSVGAASRFGCHGAVAIALLWVLGVPDTGLTGVAATVAGGALCVVGFLWVAGYTNAFNFMDGINGLAAGQATLGGLGTAGLALAAGLPVSHPVVVLSLVAAGAAAGFLPHNFPRARMFMGDVSSAPLGCLLAALGWWLANSAGWLWLVPVGLLHANFVLDTGVTLVRRVVRGERWHEAHREHFYQRLIRSGKSHAFVSGWELGLQGAVALVVIGAARLQSVVGWGVAVGFVIALWGVFFVFAERRFRAVAAPESRR